MKFFIKSLICLALSLSCCCSAKAQYAQRYQSSIGLQYGLLHYNADRSSVVDASSDYFLNIGLNYKICLSAISKLSLTSRYYEWKVDGNTQVNTTAGQVMWQIQARKIGSGWKLNRFIPYLALGLGYEGHVLRATSKADSSFSNGYIPVEAGLSYSLSSRWALGVFGEYKLASNSDINEFFNSPSLKTASVNTAGISLAYSFGKNRKRVGVPVVYTRPIFAQSGSKIKEQNQLNTSAIADANSIKTSEIGSVEAAGNAANNRATLSRKPHAEFVKIDGAIVPTRAMERQVIDSIPAPALVLRAPAEVHQSAAREVEEVIDSKPGGAFLEMPRNNYQAADLSSRGRIDSLEREIGLVKQELARSRSYQQAQDAKLAVAAQQLAERKQREIPVALVLENAPAKRSENVAMASQQEAINQPELRQSSGDTGEVRRNIQALSREIAIATGQLALMRREVAARHTDTIFSQAQPDTASASLQNNLDTLQYKLDSALAELKFLRNKDSVLRSKLQTGAIVQQSANDAKADSAIQLLHNQNRMLAALVEQSKKPKEAVVATPTEHTILYTVTFGVNSFALSEKVKADLTALADTLPRNGKRLLMLSGYADKSGNAAYNLKLSEKRIKSVKSQLLKLGVRETSIVQRNFGSSKAEKTLSESERKVVIRRMDKL